MWLHIHVFVVRTSEESRPFAFGRHDGEQENSDRRARLDAFAFAATDADPTRQAYFGNHRKAWISKRLPRTTSRFSRIQHRSLLAASPYSVHYSVALTKCSGVYLWYVTYMRGKQPGTHALQQPTVVLLKEGTDTSQGKPQLLSNISACLAVAETLSSTLGPRGMDKLIVNERGEAQITNDGATILKLLDIVHPAARTLVDIARAQDAEVGDGTTSVVLFAAQLLKEVRGYVEEGVSPHIIMKGFRKAAELVSTRQFSDQDLPHARDRQLNTLSPCKSLWTDPTPSTSYALLVHVTHPNNQCRQFRSLLLKCASTSMSSKLIHSEKPFFSNMVVDAVQCLDQEDLNENLIGVKKIPGGGMQDSLLVQGVAFKKTFTYAGAEQQPKAFRNPLILSLNVELELKAEKDNAEVRVEHVSDYQAIVDAEWEIIYRKLEAIEKTGAKVVLSKLPIGDLATQWFADRDIFCAGRVPADDLTRVVQAVGGSIQSTCSDIKREHLGTCGYFEEKQIGGERYNLFTECPKAKTCTLILRGGAEQFIEEVERSLHDAIMVVKRAVKNGDIVAGGGAIEVRLLGRPPCGLVLTSVPVK